MRISPKIFPDKKPVDYKTFRHSIKSGDLLLCSGSVWTSELIQKATNSCWSHVGLVMRLDDIDRVVVLESVESTGVRTVPLSKYVKNYGNDGKPYAGGVVIARHLEFKKASKIDAARRKFGQSAVDLLGRPYDREEVARIAVRIASLKIGLSKQYKKELDRDEEYICSEYVEECYRSINIKIPYDNDFVTPADFARDKNVCLVGVLLGK